MMPKMKMKMQRNMEDDEDEVEDEGGAEEISVRDQMQGPTAGRVRSHQ